MIGLTKGPYVGAGRNNKEIKASPMKEFWYINVALIIFLASIVAIFYWIFSTFRRIWK